MRSTHAYFAFYRGNEGCYDPLPMLMERYGNAMNPSGLSLILPQSDMVESNGALPAASHGGREWNCLPDPIVGEIADFLDGRTHGEGLLHALYDYVLDESIPERLRELLEK
jgi:hypothetical protein